MKNLMNNEEFHQFLIAQLENRILPNGLIIEALEVDLKPKEGGGMDSVLRVRLKGVTIEPRFSLSDYFEAYQEGREPHEIVEHIFDNKCFDYVANLTFDVNHLMEYEKVKDNIMCHLISDTEENVKYLENRVKIPMANTSLATVFSILVESNDEGENTIPITHPVLQTWGISEAQLHTKAKENTPRLRPAIYISLEELMENLVNNTDTSHQEPVGTGLLAISNPSKIKGAYCILYDGVADKLRAHFQEDFFILPSSCHEVIVLPQSYGNTSDLHQMVSEINESNVSAEDFLADDVYVIKDNQLQSAIFCHDTE